eukprot:5556964-Pleurochrysis_carterae.AAC.1
MPCWATEAWKHHLGANSQLHTALRAIHRPRHIFRVLLLQWKNGALETAYCIFTILDLQVSLFAQSIWSLRRTPGPSVCACACTLDGQLLGASDLSLRLTGCLDQA